MTISSPRAPRILVVDDEPTLRLGFTFALKTEDYEVSTAANGREALAVLREKEFDLVLLDMRMPEMNGLETLSELRKEPDFRFLPVILCSAHIDSAAAVEALNHACFHFLPKPILPAELRQTVAALLRPSPTDNSLQRALGMLRRGKFGEACTMLEQADATEFPNLPFWQKVAKDLEQGDIHGEELDREFPDFMNCLLA